MRGFWLLVHVLGFTLWLGGGIATMVAGVSAKSFAPAERLSAYKLIGAIQRILVGPGAMAVLLSGLVLSMPYMKQGAVPGWMGVMMIAGILGALGAVTISVPTAAKLARLEVDPRGGLPEAFQVLRKRQIFAATIAGGFGLIAMLAVTLGSRLRKTRKGKRETGKVRPPDLRFPFPLSRFPFKSHQSLSHLPGARL